MCSMKRMGGCVGGVFTRSFVLRRVDVGKRMSGYGCRSDKRVCFAVGSTSKAVGTIVFTKDHERKLGFPVGRNSHIIIAKSIRICRESNECRVCTQAVRQSKRKGLCLGFRTLGQRLRRVKVFTRRCGRPVPACTGAIKVIATRAKTTVRSVHGVTKHEGPCIRLVLYPTLIRKRNTTTSVIRKVRTLRRVNISMVVIKQNNKSVRSL